MAMLSSYTLLSRAPAPGPKFSPATATARLQLRKQLPPPAVASSVAAHARSPAGLLSSCATASQVVKRVLKSTRTTSNPVLALQNTPTSASAGEDWNVMGDKDLVILKLRVGDLSGKDKVEVGITADQTHLVIKYTGDTNDETQASKLNVTLALPSGYGDSKVQARWFDGWLVILIAKRPEKTDTKQIDKKIEILQ